MAKPWRIIASPFAGFSQEQEALGVFDEAYVVEPC
jgi:hypothetical protein